jgi:hypothetical protein
MTRTLAALTAALVVTSAAAAAESPLTSLKRGTPELKSAGPLAFGPEGILFVGDPQAGAIFAIDTGDRTAAAKDAGRPTVEGVDGKIASLLGIETAQLLVNDLAVNPISGTAYLSVSRGRGPDAQGVIVKVARDGKLGLLELKDVPFAKAMLPNPADGKGRTESITDLGYVDGKLIVAGLSSEEFSSTLRALAFPFTGSDRGVGVEIFHGAHGKLETRSPVRTFVPVNINGETQVLAAYTCTPLVRIPASDIKAGQKVRGTTVAELGNRNRPLDMIAYTKGGKGYLLIANSARGLMKVPTEGIDKADGIEKPVTGGGTAGVKYDSVKDAEGVEQLDRFDDSFALVVVKAKDGSLTLRPFELP